MKYQQLIRYDKIFSESFYLLNKTQYDNKLCFDISGSSSNIYKVNIYYGSKMIYCNCPDAKKWAKNHGVICKHCCFILFKVLKLNSETYKSYLDVLIFTPSEVETIKEAFQKINMNNQEEFINQEYIEKHRQLLVKKQDNQSQSLIPKQSQDNLCCICYDEFEDISNQNKNKQCKVCLTILHKSCLNKWLSSGNNTCPYCRSIIHNTQNSYYLNLFD